MSGKRVLVVASSPVVRAGLESLLARNGDYVVLGAATLPDRSETTPDPDVIVLALDPDEPDLSRHDLPGAATVPMPPVVILGDHPLAEWGSRALRRGARAVLPQGASAMELVAAIEAAAAGLVALPPELLGSLANRTAGPVATAPQTLTAREVEILGLLAAGLANKTIAGRLGISEHTVKTHVGSLFGKLGVSSRAEAVAVAVRQGILML